MAAGALADDMPRLMAPFVAAVRQWRADAMARMHAHVARTRANEALRARKLSDEPRCERCLVGGRLTQATEVHHRKPIAAGGGKYDWANLESVCGDCQDEAHGARPKIRIDPRTGLPLPGQDHPWSVKE